MQSWKQIQETVQKSICASAYSTWIAPLDFDKIDLDTLYIVSPTRFIADWVKRNFFSSILSATQSVIPNIKDDYKEEKLYFNIVNIGKLRKTMQGI